MQRVIDDLAIGALSRPGSEQIARQVHSSTLATVIAVEIGL